MNGGGESGEALRGWIDIPLNEDGLLVAENTAQHLKDLPILKLMSSDLVRTVQTAQEISGVINRPVYATPMFRPWNVGYLAGKPLKQILDQMLDFIDHFEEKVPDGESFQTFLERYLPSILPLVECKPLYCVVAHARNCMVLEGLCLGKGKYIDTSTLRKPCRVEPGGMIIVQPDWTYEILNPKAEFLKRPTRVNKSAALYIHGQNTDYQCRDCCLFIPEKQRCVIHGPNDIIKAEGTCGYWVQGKPINYDAKPVGSVTKIESGYEEKAAGFSCKRCEYYLPSKQDCQKVDPSSEGADEGIIHKDGCCAIWSD